MQNFSLVFTAFFILLGPVKIIPAFAQLTQGADARYKRALAGWGAAFALGIAAFVALAGQTFVLKYHISLSALRIAGGLVLLIAALHVMFAHPRPPEMPAVRPSVLQLAVSPLAMPTIVPPAGIAAILIFIMLAGGYPGMWLAIVVSLASILVLDYLVMLFNDAIVAIPGVLLIFRIVGGVLLFLQVALAIQIMAIGIHGARAIEAVL